MADIHFPAPDTVISGVSTPLNTLSRLKKIAQRYGEKCGNGQCADTGSLREHPSWPMRALFEHSFAGLGPVGPKR